MSGATIIIGSILLLIALGCALNWLVTRYWLGSHNSDWTQGE